MSVLLSPDTVSAYREGHVMNNIVCNLGCCCPSQDVEEIFSYIEVIDQNGGRHFYYEDQKGYDRFEADFHQRRFTSFHEFWTTEEAAEEQRGLFSFRYYVRRPESCYTKLPLAEIRSQLISCRRLPDRVTQFHSYDQEVNYH